MNAFAVEELIKRYSKLSDKELIDEYKWRFAERWTRQKIGADGELLLANIRKALWQLIIDRGLEYKEG